VAVFRAGMLMVAGTDITSKGKRLGVVCGRNM
jgi:hypothetical protein